MNEERTSLRNKLKLDEVEGRHMGVKCCECGKQLNLLDSILVVSSENDKFVGIAIVANINGIQYFLACPHCNKINNRGFLSPKERR